MTGDLGDEFEVLVEMQHRELGQLSGRSDQEIGNRRRSMLTTRRTVVERRPGREPDLEASDRRERPEQGMAWPQVVMFHDGPGIREATHEFASKLAGEGFDVLVPDLYHRHGRMLGWELHEREADPSILDRLWEMLRSLTDAGVQADLDATVSALGDNASESMVMIGFCVGARAAFRSMMRFPERFVAGAMWHPSFLVDDQPDSPHLTAAGLARPLFLGIGEADQMQPLSSHLPFLDAVRSLPGVEVATYPGADHGYIWPGWPSYDEAAATASFASTVQDLPPGPPNR